jgi:cytochrome c2
LRGFGAAALFLFTTMLHTGLLGALITFATTPWYVSSNAASTSWSLTPLEDQQLGGLIMWVPAGLVYLIAALALVAGWLRASGRRTDLSMTLTQAGVSMLVVAMTLFSGCRGEREREAARLTGGWPDKGREEIQRAGCAACHTIPGIPGADRLVGPPLRGIASRDYIGGVLPNTPENMVKWLQDPPAHSPKTVMPRLNLTEQQARDISAYLYTLTRP